MNSKFAAFALVGAMAGAMAAGFVTKPEPTQSTATTGNVAVASQSQIEENLRNAFGARAPIDIASVTKFAGGQILEVAMTNGQLIHMSPDGQHVITGGEVLKLANGSFENLTEARLNPVRAELMAAVDDDDTVIFKAENEKAVMNVFTDIDCGYCRKLHKEIPELNALGVTVRYLAYPRAGEMNPRTGQLTSSFKKIKSVWCNDDRNTAMTEAKNMQQVSEDLSCDAPITEQMQLGQQVGVNGTPAIVFADGTFVGGYRPAAALAQQILAN